MRGITTAVAVTILAFAFAQHAAASEALAKSNGCLNCHAVDTKKVGPSFKSVAEKYKGDAKAESTLTAQVSPARATPPSRPATTISSRSLPGFSRCKSETGPPHGPPLGGRKMAQEPDQRPREGAIGRTWRGLTSPSAKWSVLALVIIGLLIGAGGVTRPNSWSTP